jgi:hypothetical protein
LVNIRPAQDDLTPFQRRLRGLPPVDAPTLPTIQRAAPTESLLRLASPRAQEESVSARVLKTALHLKAPTDLVEANLEEAEKVAAEKDLAPEKLTPVLAKWYAKSPHHIAVTKEDVKSLQDLERIYYRKDDPLRKLTDEEFESMAQRIGKRQGQAAMRADRSRVGLDPFVPNLFKTQQEAIEIYTQRARESLREQEDYVTGQGKAGAFTAPGSGIRKIPVAGVGIDLAEASLLESMKRIKAGNPTEEDEDAIFLFGRMQAAAAARGQTFGGKVLEGIASLPGFAAEFGLTGGAYRAGKVGAEMALRNSLKTVLSGRARGLVRSGIGVATGGVTQTAAQTAFGSLPADALKRMAPGIEITPDEEGKLQAVLGDDGEDIIPAITKAFGSRVVENLSERSGIALTKIIAPMKAAIASRWFKLNPGKTPNDFLAKVAKKSGWNGMVEEMFEERVGGAGRAVLGIEDYKPPTLEELATEAMTFSVPGAGAALTRAAFGKSQARQNRDYFKSIQKTVREAKVSGLAPEALEDLVGRFAENGGADHAYVPSEAWVEAFGKLGKDPRAEALSLGVSESSYDRAIEVGGDLQLPMAPFAMRVLREPHGDAFITLARTEPEQDNLEDAGQEPKEIPKAPDAVLSQEVSPAPITREEAGVKDATPQEWDEIQARAKLADTHIKEAAEATQALMTFFPDRHMEAVERAKGSARQAFMEKAMDSIRRKRMTEYRQERSQIRDEVEAEVNSRKEYVALSMLRNGTLPSGAPAAIQGLKLSREDLAENFPAMHESSIPRGLLGDEKRAEIVDLERKIEAQEDRLSSLRNKGGDKAKIIQTDQKLKKFRKELDAILSSENANYGTSLDVLAETLGYSSGSEMLMGLIDAEYRFPRETLIEDLTNARMAERHQELEADPSRAGEEAIQALHNTERSKLLIQDLKHLISNEFASFKGMLKKIVGSIPRLEEVKKWAETEVRKETYRTLQPGVHRRDAKTASRKALDAFLKGDFQTAFDQRINELKSNELAIAALKLQEEAKAIPKFMRKFQKRSIRQALARAGAEKYLGPVDEIIERFEFSPVSVSKVEERQSLQDWYANEIKEGRNPVVPEKLLRDAAKTNWKDVKLSDLLDIKKAVENIAHIARTKNKLRTSREKKEFDSTVTALVNSMEFYRPGKKKTEPVGDLTVGERVRRKLAQGVAGLRKASNIALELDGWKDGGSFWEAFILPMNQAQEREQDMAIKGASNLFGIFSVYSRKERRQMRRRAFIPEINTSLSMWDRIGIALNWGNVENQEALMLGYGWSREQVEKVLSGLSKRDLKVVQEVFDHVDSYWPEVKALAERVDGLAPEKVEAKSFTVTTADGNVTLKGGYYPLRYKPDATKPHQTVDELVDQSMRGVTVRASTRHAHRKEREGSGGRQVRLDLGVLNEHERDVIHDITHYEWLLDANKLLRNSKIADAIKGSVGAEHYDELIRTVNAIALNNRQAVDSYGRLAEWAARRTRAATLVFNLGTILKQYLGLAASGNKIGWGWTARGLWAAGFGSAQTKAAEEWMTGLSTFMKNRKGNQDRDQAEVMKDTLQPGGEPGVIGAMSKAAERAGFNLIGATQWHVDRATWLGAYQKYSEELSLDKAGSEQERNAIEDRIVSMADQAVRDSQGSGLLADLPAVMRSRGYARLLTLFRTFAVGQLNLFASKAFPAGQRPSAATISQAATALVSLYIVPAMLWDYVRTALVGGDDEEAITVKRATTTALKEIAFGLPLLGEVAPVVDLASGEGARDYRGPSGLSLIAEGFRLAQQVGQVVNDGEDQLDSALLRSAVRASGIAVPGANAIDRLIGGYLSWEERDAQLPAMLLGGPAKR